MVKQIWNENGNIFPNKGVTLVLLKVLLFKLSGRGNPHDDATPNLISDSYSCILGLSNEVSFISGFFLKGGQNSQNVWLKILLYVYTCRSVYIPQLRKCTSYPLFFDSIALLFLLLNLTASSYDKKNKKAEPLPCLSWALALSYFPCWIGCTENISVHTFQFTQLR